MAPEDSAQIQNQADPTIPENCAASQPRNAFECLPETLDYDLLLA
jgi:hypothetical protein